MKIQNVEIEFTNDEGIKYKRLFSQVEGKPHQITQMETSVYINWMIFNLEHDHSKVTPCCWERCNHLSDGELKAVMYRRYVSMENFIQESVVCSCGKEKHNFFSHSHWCKKSPHYIAK